MSNRSKKKLPIVAFLPNHVLIHPVPPSASLRAHQSAASEADEFGSSTMTANRMLVEEDHKPAAAVLDFLQVEGIDCRNFYETKDRNPKVLFGFLVGLSPKEDLGLKMTFSLNKPPFRNKKRECKPTSKIMQQEVIRRSSLQGVSRMPRPAQWSTEKLHEALSVRYPPKLTVDDIVFLRTTCNEIYDQAIKRSKKEQSVNDNRQKKFRWTKDEGWNDPKSMLRLYHILMDLRELFVIRNITEVASAKDFWTIAADLYNSEAWVPSTVIIPKLEGFKQSTPLPLITKKVTAIELAIIFGGIKPKLRDLVDEWNTSFLPTEMLKENEIVEQWDYAALTNRLESREDVEGHVMYLWEFANNNKMLGSCMLPRDAEPETREEAENLTEEDLKQAPTEASIEEVADQEHDERYDEESEGGRLESVKVVTTHEATAPEPIQKSAIQGPTIQEPAIQELAIQEQAIQNPAIQNPAIQKHAIPDDVDTQHFTTSQELNFEVLRVYNTVETELFELKVKAVLAKTSEERKLYQQFSWRKQKVLAALQCHLERSTRYVSQLSQNFRAPPIEVADLPEPELDDFPDDETTKRLPSITRQPKLGTKQSSSYDDSTKKSSSYDGSTKKICSNNTLPSDEMEEEPTEEEDASSDSNATKESCSEEDVGATISKKGCKRKTIQEIIDQAEEGKTSVAKEGEAKRSRKLEEEEKSTEKGEEASEEETVNPDDNDEGEYVEDEPATEVTKKNISLRKAYFKKTVKMTTPTKEANEEAKSQPKNHQRDLTLKEKGSKTSLPPKKKGSKTLSQPKKKGLTNSSPPKKEKSTDPCPPKKRGPATPLPQIAVTKQEDTPRRASRHNQAVEASTRRVSSRRASTSKSEESAKKKRRTK